MPAEQQPAEHDPTPKPVPGIRLRSSTTKSNIRASKNGKRGRQQSHSKADQLHPPRNRDDYVNSAHGAGHASSASHIYLGSYARNARSRSSFNVASSNTSPASAAPSPRTSVSHIQIQRLLEGVNAAQETYGVEELREGFFDATFVKPHHGRSIDDDAWSQAEGDFPSSPLKREWQWILQQWRETSGVFVRVATTRAGVKLTKSFLGFFISYIICLIPEARNWLGRYSYVLAISAILHHPGRMVGSQIDGTVLVILGAAIGLGWGALALYASTSTDTAASGYGGVLAAFLVVFAAAIAYLRCSLIRFYQAVIAAGVAVFYTCLADTSRGVSWGKLSDFAIPFVLGQAICLVVCSVVLPDAGSRALA